MRKVHGKGKHGKAAELLVLFCQIWLEKTPSGKQMVMSFGRKAALESMIELLNAGLINFTVYKDTDEVRLDVCNPPIKRKYHLVLEDFDEIH